MDNKSTDSSLLERKIIHVDMDAFYASVEIRDNPDLANRPIAVGGAPTSRGVILTANYEARTFGVRSAISCAMAAKLCRDLVFVKPRFEAYQEASNKIREIFLKYTQYMQPLSLDEAYLDVTDSTLGLYASKIANIIRQEIFEETKLTCSAGVAPNKMLAKIASDLRKPNGMTVILPHKVTDFMTHLPLRKISGIGPKSEEKLAAKGFRKCSDLWHLSEEELIATNGKHGEWLYNRSRGIDHSQIRDYFGPKRKRKSYGRETTFREDILDKSILTDKLQFISGKISRSLQRKNVEAKTLTLKVKYSDFERITRSYTLDRHTANDENIFNIATNLLDKTEAGNRKIRLIGISMSNINP